MSPRKSCSLSMVLTLSATTELSSFTASSTTRRFGAFFRSSIAVLKSFFLAPPLHERTPSLKSRPSVVRVDLRRGFGLVRHFE